MGITQARYELSDLRQELRAEGWNCNAISAGKVHRVKVEEGDLNYKMAERGYITTVIEPPYFQASKGAAVLTVTARREWPAIAIVTDSKGEILLEGAIIGLRGRLAALAKMLDSSLMDQMVLF